MGCNRRIFLKTSSLTAAALALQTVSVQVAAQAALPVNGKEEKVTTVCALCRARCAMVAHIRDGHLRLQGNPYSPMNGKQLCARGLASSQILDDVDRLKFPMRRVGKRGSGSWRRISWKEATTEIVSQLRKALKDHGPESLALLCGGPSSHYIRTLFGELGATVYDASFAHAEHIRALGYGPIFGSTPDPLVLPEAENVDCLVLIGSHLGENVQVPQLQKVCAMLAGGSKLIVADPRMSVMAAKADFHLALRPGTDTALLLGWIHFLIYNDLLDHQRLERDFLGFAELRDHVADFTPERVAALTDLPQDLITATGWLMGSQPGRTLVLPGSHLSWYGNDVRRVQAQAILTALLGSDFSSAGATPFDFRLGPQLISYSGLVSAMAETLQVVGIWGQNPLQSEVSPYKTIAALQKVPFIFGADVLPSEPMLYADIILPEASFLERMDVVEMWQHADQHITSCRFPVRKNPYECRGPYEIVKPLADELGYGELFPHNSVAEHLNTQLIDQGTSLDAIQHAGGLLVKDQKTPVAAPLFGGEDRSLLAGEDTEIAMVSYATPSGKIELVSSWFIEHGLPPLPSYTSPQPVPAGYVRLLYGRSPVYTQASTAGYSWLNHEIAENTLWLSEQKATIFGVQNGQEVWLENQDGIRAISTVTVKVTPGIRDDCCYLAHGFGCRSPLIRAAFLRGVSDTSLMTRGVVDPVSGVRGMRDNFVRIVKG